MRFTDDNCANWVRIKHSYRQSQYPNPKRTESSKESSSATPVIISFVVLGLVTCITFIAVISSNGPNDWKNE